MKTILIPLDGSRRAEQVLPYVQLLAPLLDAQATLLCVVADLEPESLRAATFAAMYRQDSRAAPLPWVTAMRRQAEIYLAHQAARLQEIGLRIDVEVREGRPADLIVDTAAADDVALIAMGTHGYRGVQRWALGSVADKVLHITPIPLLLVRPGLQAGHEEPWVIEVSSIQHPIV